MFVHDFVRLDISAKEAYMQLIANGPAWLEPMLAAAYKDGEELRIRIGPGSKAKHVSKAIRLDIGIPYERQDTLVLPISWIATGPAALFPSMDADLEIAPLGDSQTQMSFLGRYKPPLGAFGQAIDSLLLHRVAEASVRSFLHRIAEQLESPVLVVPEKPPLAPTTSTGIPRRSGLIETPLGFPFDPPTRL